MLAVVFGLFVALTPVIGAVVLAWWLGVYAIALGIVELMLAFRLRSRHVEQPPLASPQGRERSLSRRGRRTAAMQEGARLGLARLQRMAGLLPAVGAFGIPGDIGVAERQGALGRVPGHPAIGEAIEDERAALVLGGRALEGVRRDSARVASDRAPKPVSGSQTLPGMSKRGLSRQTASGGRPAGLGGRGSTSTKTAALSRQIAAASRVASTRAPCQGRRHGSAVIVEPIAGRLRRFFLRGRADGEQRRGESDCEGSHGAIVIGAPASSISGTP